MVGLTNKLLIGVVVLVIVGVGTFFAIKSVNNVSKTTPVVETNTMPSGGNNSVSPSESATSSVTAGQNTVVVSDSGFSPQSITIKIGDTVTWMNSDSVIHTVNSDQHPTHSLYPILNQIGRIAAGEKKLLNFPAAGTFKYHDHLNPQLIGTVIVQ